MSTKCDLNWDNNDFRLYYDFNDNKYYLVIKHLHVTISESLAVKIAKDILDFYSERVG